jgi:raffinose/stachyose/melibiose transport system permease protein
MQTNNQAMVERIRIGHLASRIFIGLLAFVFAMPIYLAVVNVFKTEDQIQYYPIALPDPFTLENLTNTLNRPDNLLFEGLMNSLLITGTSVFLLVIFSSAIGFYIGRSKNRYIQMLLFAFVAGMLIPVQVILIPASRLLDWLGLMGTFPGLILLQVGGGLLSFAVFVYTGFVKTIPRELDESAMIDGASRFTLFWRIIFPLMRPATATVVIFVGLWSWNEFLLPLIILGPGEGITITTGIYSSASSLNKNYGQMFSLMFLSALPVLAVFFVLQKEFIEGLTGGSIKG